MNKDCEFIYRLDECLHYLDGDLDSQMKLIEMYESNNPEIYTYIDNIRRERLLREENLQHRLNESIKGSVLRKGIKHMNDRQLQKCINSILNKLKKKDVKSEYISELNNILNESDTEIKRSLLLKIINRMEEKNPKAFQAAEDKIEKELEKENILKEDFLSEKWWSAERGEALFIHSIVLIVDLVIQVICLLTLEIIFPLMLPIDIFMIIFTLTTNAYDGYGPSNRERKKLLKLKNDLQNN